MKNFKLIYHRLFQINDTPQRIALGLGLGVCLGIIPGTGPVASLFLATLFRLNCASALLGSLLTNLWLSLVTFLLSLKVGSYLLRVNWQVVLYDWELFLKNFRWQNLLKITVLKTILPVILGYFVVAFAIGFVVYLITLIILIKAKKWRK